MGNLSFCHQTYCRLLNQSSKLAEDYRNDCGLKKEKPVILKEELEKEELEKEELEKEAYTPIEIMGLSPKILNALIKGNILSIEQLTKCVETKLSSIKGFGKKAMTEIRASLGKINLKLLGKEKLEIVDKDKIKEYTKDDLIKLLSEGKIKFFNGAKTEKLLEICIKNELI